MTYATLFSGIGGPEIAAESLGWQCLFNCEFNPFCQAVLKYHFPETTQYHDVTETDFTIHRNRIGCLIGGFPCQPYSQAGKRLGKEDDRHLWPQMLRAVREIRPPWVVGENVLGIVNWDAGLVFSEVQTDLEAEGYEVQPYVLPASGVGAPHQRYRCFFIAYSDGAAKEYNARSHQATPETLRRKQARNVPGAFCSTWNAANPDSARHGRLRNPESKTGTQKSNELPGSQRGISDKSNAANTASRKGRQNSKARLEVDGEILRETRRNEGSELYRHNGEVGNAANPDRKRHEKRKPATKSNKPERFDCKKDSEAKPGSWQNFPTQPPVCGRNDGLPGQLDGITFSKWRNESLKAYGNAIVPQHILPILKAIDAYENP